MTRYIVHIKASGKVTATPTEERHLDYRTIQSGVGGYIEQVRPASAGGMNLVLWCNEEGKLLGLDDNPAATSIARGAIQDRDSISGDAVLTIGEGPEVRGLTLREISTVATEFELGSATRISSGTEHGSTRAIAPSSAPDRGRDISI